VKNFFERGKGWVAETEDQIVGFSIIDLKENNIWALFVHPDFENKGIGRNFTMSCSTGILKITGRIYGLELLLKQELKHSTACLAGKNRNPWERGN
jgi:GNAT superfamily N-acetyltransferase